MKTTRMRISVTQDHNDAAEFMREQQETASVDEVVNASLPPYSCRCPLAIALMCMGVDKPRVSPDNWTSGDDWEQTLDLPAKAARTVEDFDERRTVHPATFIMKVPL